MVSVFLNWQLGQVISELVINILLGIYCSLISPKISWLSGEGPPQLIENRTENGAFVRKTVPENRAGLHDGQVFIVPSGIF